MSVVLAERMKQLASLDVLYRQAKTPEEIAALQLERFNAHWSRAWKTVPFYQKWREDNTLPKKINNLNELVNFPILTKKHISDGRDLIARSPGNTRSTLTGGTSGISTPFPMGKADADASWVNTHLGRGWNTIRPGDRLFMIWGHSHLFGGKDASIKQFKRQVRDKLNNIKRVSAYNLNDVQLAHTTKALLKFKPKYVIGYGSCLARLCDYLEAENLSIRDAGVSRVVNTSETLNTVDASRVAAAFGCPIINEYGMAEAGVIGYSRDSLYPIRVFWNDFVIRTLGQRLLLTTLGAGCFPLINYDTEDLCADSTPVTGSLLQLSNLLGKARDIFDIIDVNGQSHEVSVVLFDHILKQISPLRSLHYELDQDGIVRISYTTTGEILNHGDLVQRFVAGMKVEGIAIDTDSVKFSHLDIPLQTVAGKRQTLVRER